jgi:hypothetical protein
MPLRKALFAFVTLLATVGGLAHTLRAEPPPPASWRVFLEPKFLRPPCSGPIPGADRTVFAAGSLGESGLETMTKENFDSLKLSWPGFFEQARANADADLAALTCTYVRNKKKVIEYAELRSEQGTIPSAVLAPKFLIRFADTLGPTVVVAVPSRDLALVFPKLASRCEDYASVVFRAYRESAHPVTLELFEVTPTGTHAIGRFPDPAHD